MINSYNIKYYIYLYIQTVIISANTNLLNSSFSPQTQKCHIKIAKVGIQEQTNRKYLYIPISWVSIIYPLSSKMQVTKSTKELNEQNRYIR